jgi:hypothetical protein
LAFAFYFKKINNIEQYFLSTISQATPSRNTYAHFLSFTMKAHPPKGTHMKLGLKMNQEHSRQNLHASRQSSSKELLKSIKVDEAKCESEIGVSSLFDDSCVTIEALNATFATYVATLGVRIMP